MAKKPTNPTAKSIKKAIKLYYEALQSYRDQGIKHEGALQTAFQQLLADAAKVHHCTLIPQQPYKKLRPDGHRPRFALGSGHGLLGSQGYR